MGRLRWGLRTLKLLLATMIVGLCVVPAASVPVPVPLPPAANTQAVAALPSMEPTEAPGSEPLGLLRVSTALTDVSARHSGAPLMTAEAGILVDIDTRTILWEHYPDTPRPPASTSKLMAAMVALQNFPLDQRVTVSAGSANRDGVETKMGLLAGQRLTVRELLTGMMVVSANDAAMTMGNDVVGMDRFVATMNAQARALGLRHSHFTNPSGYPDDPGQMASAQDLAVMMMVNWEYFPAFQQLAGIAELTLPANPDHPLYEMHNVLRRVFSVYPPTVAGKSGFTDGAGPCLVTLAARDRHHLVSVLMNARDMVNENRALMEWGFVQEGVAPLPAPSPSPSPAPAVRRR
jgi:D-alanyl-D-alanine carboxypeptidase (penicillin-binding protein 5/6)